MKRNVLVAALSLSICTLWTVAAPAEAGEGAAPAPETQPNAIAPSTQPKDTAPATQPDEKEAPSTQPDDSPVAAIGDFVKVHYTGRLENGEVFDTSRKARRPGMAIEPLAFTVGAGQMIKAFDEGVRGMKQSERKKITCPPKDAYGKHKAERVRDFPKAALEQQLGVAIKKGMKIPTRMGFAVTVTKVAADTVTIDMNHPLAGKTLIFDVELVELKKKAG